MLGVLLVGVFNCYKKVVLVKYSIGKTSLLAKSY